MYSLWYVLRNGTSLSMDIHLQVQLDDFELPSQSSILYKACIIIVGFQNILATRRLRVFSMLSPCLAKVVSLQLATATIYGLI